MKLGDYWKLKGIDCQETDEKKETVVWSNAEL